MPTVTPVFSVVQAQGQPVVQVKWTGIITGDTIVPVALPGKGMTVRAAIQISGTFGGATVTMQMSNDNSTYTGMKDAFGTTISSTSAAVWDVINAALYFKPVVTSGSANAIDVTIIMRG